MTAEDSLHRIFAQNLYALSVRSGSIAETCRQLGINRQQFNKYLAGTTLPNSTTLLKISNHFGVDQRSLFVNADEASQVGFMAEAPFQGMAPLSALDARILAELEGTRCTSLIEGCYSLYFPGLTSSDRFRRSAMFVRNVEDRTIFVRLSSGKIETAKLHKAQMRHEGLAIESDNRIYLVAKNRFAHREISLLSFGKVDLPVSRIFGGLALTLARWGVPISTRFSAEYIGPWSERRRAIEAIGEFPLESPEISEELRRSLSSPLKSTEAVLGPYDFFDHLRGRYM